MSILEVTSLSTRGQVVIPNDIREKMKLEPGTKMIIIQEGDNILLKPIKVPKMSQFDKIIAIGDDVRNELNLKESDVEKAIQDVRNRKNAHSS
jgi:antitoxin PrlF